ncbi:MAG: phosphoribosylglycinamide formyltransferase [Cyanobacteria bacterium J083]|nr:MAG: phosphoribosylglycinamide formyltransferase [Cyanobacteria bacterium J083]
MLNDYLISPPQITKTINLTQPLRLGVMASGNGSNFAALAAAISRGELPGEIVVVIYNNPAAKVKLRAEQLGIPAILLNHRQYNTREALDEAIAAELKARNVNWVIMAGWMRIVTTTLINQFPQRIINIHPSLLPSFKGIRAIEQALAAGVKITGCTVHLVSPEVDSGKILIQAAVPILPEDDAVTLHQRVQVQEHRILPLGIKLAVAEEIQQKNYKYSKT